MPVVSVSVTPSVVSPGTSSDEMVVDPSSDGSTAADSKNFAPLGSREAVGEVGLTARLKDVDSSSLELALPLELAPDMLAV